MRRLLVLALSLLTFAAPVFAESPAREDIRTLIEGLRQRKQNTGMAVAVFSSQDILHVSTHGFADVETQRPVSEHSLFMIGSTTKAMTAAAAGYLVEDGALEWDTRVKALLPQFKLKDNEASEQATLRDLLLHRTGLARHDLAWYSRSWTSEEYLERLVPHLEPSTAFRSKWQYQNLMYMVAGMMAGASVHSTWDEVVQKRLFDNLGMTHSRPLSSQVQATDDLALPHVWTGSQHVRVEARNIDGVGPAGSVHSSILDMIKWGQFNLTNGRSASGEALDAAIMAEIHRPQISMGQRNSFPEFDGEFQYAFGWIVVNYRGQPLYGHGGAIDGYLTSMYFSPARDVGVIVLTNGGVLVPEAVALTVLDHVIGVEAVDWLQRMEPEVPSFPQDVEFPDAYTAAEGRFEHPVYGELQVRQIGSGDAKFLSLNLNGGAELYVTPWLTDDPARWAFEYMQHRIYFHLSEDGHVQWIDANLEPAIGLLRFVRRPDAL